MQETKTKLNFQTINVFNFINSSKTFMDMARQCTSYKEFSDWLLGFGIVYTHDEVSLSDIDLNYEFLDEFIECLSNEGKIYDQVNP